ncbi:MAG: hypothetical protein K1Y02_26710, partial [Candidatus Hydrogenedentes bacterium]|nr:hypothetical protein [Candidatus Hydrogenedentota bacterium]
MVPRNRGKCNAGKGYTTKTSSEIGLSSPFSSPCIATEGGLQSTLLILVVAGSPDPATPNDRMVSRLAA